MRSYQNLQLKQKLKEKISRNFPVNDIKYAYAYGSAVIPQKDYTGKMIDIFFIVEDVKKFHYDNLRKNFDHYSSIARNSSITTIEKVNRYGSGVYYNPSVLIEKDLLIKYGVVSEMDFVNHMTRWENLFIAGRFHKPVLSIFKEDEKIENIINTNREAAVKIS
jgi:mitochondrial translocator assembly and maintenance protein 41